MCALHGLKTSYTSYVIAGSSTEQEAAVRQQRHVVLWQWFWMVVSVEGRAHRPEHSLRRARVNHHV